MCKKSANKRQGKRLPSKPAGRPQYPVAVAMQRKEEADMAVIKYPDSPELLVPSSDVVGNDEDDVVDDVVIHSSAVRPRRAGKSNRKATWWATWDNICKNASDSDLEELATRLREEQQKRTCCQATAWRVQKVDINKQH